MSDSESFLRIRLNDDEQALLDRIETETGISPNQHIQNLLRSSLTPQSDVLAVLMIALARLYALERAFVAFRSYADAQEQATIEANAIGLNKF
jgi:hypothetical protein